MIYRWFLGLITEISFRKSFWRVRSVYQKITFRFGELTFNLKSTFANATLSISIFWQLFRSIIGSILIATIATGLIMVVSPAFGFVIPDNRSAYDSLLFGIASVAGVFLGFYFTSLNTVAGSLYAKMPERIRELLFGERVNNLSSNFVVFLTVLATQLLGVAVLWDYRSKFAATAILLLGFFAILIFVQLSKRVFYFFDPTSLSNQFIYELFKWQNLATTSGHLWADPSFQNHYQKQASNSIEGLKELVALTHHEDYLKQEPLTRLLRHTSRFLSDYIQSRRVIPSESFWYPRIAQHKAWYLSDDSAVGLATNTSTSITPEMKPDHLWIEKAILELNTSSLAQCLHDGRHTIGINILNNFNSIFRAFGDGWMLAEAEPTLITLYSEIIDWAKKNRDDTGSANFLHEHLAALDYLNILPLSLMLGFIDNLVELDLDRVATSISNLKWNLNRSIYTLHLPVATLERLEYMQKSLVFEARVENRIVSPSWYTTQLVFQSMSFILKSQIVALENIGKTFYLDQSKKLLDDNMSLQAIVGISRGLEFYNKIFARFEQIKKFGEKLKAFHKTQGLEWPLFDWQETEQSLKVSWDNLVENLAKCIPALSRTEWDKTLPDYLGQAVHTVGEECFSALLEVVLKGG